MSETILRRTRLGTLAAAVVGAAILVPTVSTRFAAGFLITALWAVAGFWILERLLKVVIVSPGTPRRGWTVTAWLMAKFALYGLAVWGLLQQIFPALSHIFGFTLLLVVLVIAGTTAGGRDAGQPARRGNDG